MSTFKYMSDSYLTTVFTEELFTCDCCREVKELKYIGPQYSSGSNDAILCAQCIQNGEAVESGLVGFFNEIDLECVDDNVSNEICYRTPGFFTWQDQEWATHCNDACEFHGDDSAQDIIDADESTIHIWMERYDQSRKDWESFMTGYVPGGDQGVYKFICKHCNAMVINWDFS